MPQGQSSWPRAVLFDFDGVVVNSEPLHFYAMHEVLQGERVEITEDEYYRELIGFDDRGAFRHVFEKRGLPLEPKTLLSVMARKSGVMMQLIHERRFQALPGVEELVRGLWRTTPLAICSGALREEIEAMLEGVALRDCFSVIVAAEDVTAGKPDPQGYLLTLRLLSEKIGRSAAHPGHPAPLKPADALVVEDAPKVIRSVKAAGFPTLGVATSYPLIKLADADWQTKTLHPDEVLGLLPQLKSKFVA
jgi:beta-phosphoglucomutase-like phosphatase (HAD superfamily)